MVLKEQGNPAPGEPFDIGIGHRAGVVRGGAWVGVRQHAQNADVVASRTEALAESAVKGLQKRFQA